MSSRKYGSSFSGLIAEYPELAVDNFSGVCLDADFFLLSHCHTDHMQGLSSPDLQRVLARLPQPRLICSQVTAALLVHYPRHGHLKPYLQKLEVGVPRQLSARLTVTALPADHCPGSVMFLLEGAGGTCLFTGDFRLLPGQLQRMSALHTAPGPGAAVKQLDTLYIDTTFCQPGRRRLPSRDVSCRHVLRLAEEWLKLGADHHVNLQCPARYGYEALFQQLCAAFGRRLHVPPDKQQLYRRLPAVSACVTSDLSSADSARTAGRVHACPDHSVCLIGRKVRTIKVSAQHFILDQRVDTVQERVRGAVEKYRVLFSTHSSLEEARRLVNYLNPRQLQPFSVPERFDPRQICSELRRCGGRGDPPSFVGSAGGEVAEQSLDELEGVGDSFERDNSSAPSDSWQPLRSPKRLKRKLM